MTRELWAADNKKLIKKEVATPEPLDDEVLVKVKAIAFNPTDYKHLDYGIASKSGLGCDFSGEVLKIGADVNNVRVGEAVSGIVPGGDDNRPDGGAFTTHLVTKADSLLKFPDLDFSPGSNLPSGFPVTWEQAASLPVGIITTMLAVHGYNHEEVLESKDRGYALVYGAVSSLGFMVSQVAIHMGYKVIAVASKKHEDLLKSVGVDTLVDYHDSDWPSQVREIAGDDVIYAYDTISTKDTLETVVQAVSKSKPVKINLSLLVDYKAPENVTIDTPLAYLIEMKEKFLGVMVPGKEEFRKDRPKYYSVATKLLTNKSIKTLPIKVVGSGLDKVPEGLDAIRSGTSGFKLVVTLP